MLFVFGLGDRELSESDGSTGSSHVLAKCCVGLGDLGSDSVSSE
jgi:hypothetical protein